MPNDAPFRPDAPERLKRGDLRDMTHGKCEACGFDWWAPVCERCPRCHAETTAITERLMIGAPRV